MKIGFITNDKGGCGYYRMILPSEILKEQHITTLLSPPSEKNLDMLQYDCFVVQRPHQSFFHQQFFPWMKNRNKKIIIDIDDNLLEIPEYNPSSKFYSNDVIDTLKLNIQMADVVVCSTNNLAEYITTKLNKKTVVIPNMINDIPDYKEQNNSKIRIGWAGSITHNGDFYPSLVQALEKITSDENIQFCIFGRIPECVSHIKNISLTEWSEIDEYHSTLKNLNLDIGIIPSNHNIFNESKSNIKFLEYSSVSTATISDSTPPYKSTITHMENGLLVNSDKEWYSHLKYLIDNEKERKRLTKNAHDFVKTNFTIKNNKEFLLNKWNDMLGGI